MADTPFSRETFTSWDQAKAAGRTDGVHPEAMAAYVGRGLVGACILMLRHVQAGHALPAYWRDGCVRVLLDLAHELQSHDT